MKAKKGTALKWAIVSLSLGFTLAAANEWTGYNAFDREGSENLICALDPSCRHLTAGEIEMAQDVFDQQIDYKNSKVFDRNFMFLKGLTDCNMSPNGNIYFPKNTGPHRVEDFSLSQQWRGHFMHEMTHVWQHYNGIDIPNEAVRTLIANSFDYNSAYTNTIEEIEFRDLNLEQQANMVQEYFLEKSALHALLKAGAAEEEIDRSCKRLTPLENKVGESLPIRMEERCAGAAIPEQKPSDMKKQQAKPSIKLESITIPSDFSLSRMLTFCGR